MKRMRIMGLCLVAVFAIAAVFAGGASAKTVLTFKTAGKGALKGGDAITAESSDLKFTTEAGSLECTSNVLNGTLANNEAAKDKGSITAESSTGEIGFGTACNTSTPFGPAAIESVHLPWNVEFKSNGQSFVKKGPNGKVAFKSKFILAPGEPECEYEAAKVISLFNPAAGSGPVELTTTEQVFKKNKKASNEACPATGKLNGHFTVSSGGEAVEL
jgi:hypothetical protein